MTQLTIGSVYETNPYFTVGGKHKYKFVRTPRDVLGCDLLVFWGGMDIPPGWYGEAQRWTSANKPQYRDLVERDIYFLARGKIPMLGICRGGQLMVALEGGKLWQDVGMAHGRSHDVTFEDGDVIKCTSSHHQMFRLTDKMKLIGWASKNLSPIKRNQDGEFEDNEKEPEFALMPDGVALAVQPHPEYEMDVTKPLTQKTFQLVDKYLGIKL